MLSQEAHTDRNKNNQVSFTAKSTSMDFAEENSKKDTNNANGHEKSQTLFKVRLQLVGDTWFESIIKVKTG